LQVARRLSQQLIRNVNSTIIGTSVAFAYDRLATNVERYHLIQHKIKVLSRVHAFVHERKLSSQNETLNVCMTKKMSVY